MSALLWIRNLRTAGNSLPFRVIEMVSIREFFLDHSPTAQPTQRHLNWDLKSYSRERKVAACCDPTKQSCIAGVDTAAEIFLDEFFPAALPAGQAAALFFAAGDDAAPFFFVG